jgi:hypothetical protein
MERPMPTPRRDAPRRNKSLEGPVPARGRRAHAPPQPAALRALLAGPPSTRLFMVRSKSLTTAPATEHARTGHHTEARPGPPAHSARRRRRLLSNIFHHEARVRILVHRPRGQKARRTPLVHEGPAPARGPPRSRVHRSTSERGGPGGPRT